MIDPDIITDAENTFDEYYNFFGKTCRLIFESGEAPCNNCIIDTKSGESTNRYNGVGPTPFPIGTECPICSGTGKLASTQQHMDIKMYLDWDIRRWMNQWGAHVAPDLQRSELVRLPGGLVTGIGWMADISKVVMCDYAIMDIDPQTGNPASMTGTDSRFKLNGAPLDSRIIMQHKYFTSFWERLQ